MADTVLNYGAELDAQELVRTLDHVFRTNLALEERSIIQHGRSLRPTPICIWGSHGIGKTALVKALAERNGWKFRYCAPAQFEEMGDLHGLPVRQDPDPAVAGDETTVYMPPDWVPQEGDEGPGILLLDDINRADDRILRGIMQLLQEFEMFSWSLPPKWQIVCTANPEGGDYSVTTMDDAMITRMLHFTMVYELKAWVRWATDAGVDPRGIDFVLSYPETVTGKRTTPRSLTQFFSQVQPIADLKANFELVRVLALSALDEASATAFLGFVQDNLSRLIGPEEILGGSAEREVADRLSALARSKDGARRVDRLSTVCTRLALHVSRKGFSPSRAQIARLVGFLKHPDLPADLRVSLHRDFLALGGDLAAGMRDPDLARMLVEGA